MKVCRVIGEVVLSHSVMPEKSYGRFCLVSPLGGKELRQLDQTLISKLPSFVTYDHLGAQAGDLIGVAESAEAGRPFDHDMPIDAYNACLIDQLQYQPSDKLP